MVSNSYHYSVLYVTKKISTGSKNDSTTPSTQVKLRKDLNSYITKIFYAENEINFLDLKIYNKKGHIPLTGHNILDIVKRGAKSFRKAMSFTTKNGIQRK